jgi:hypothetical protein
MESVQGLSVRMEGPWWEAGTLNRDVHEPIVANRHAIAQKAGLGEAYMSSIWEKLPADTHAHEMEWMKSAIRRVKIGAHEPVANLWYSGSAHAVACRFRAFTGNFIRNFVSARIIPTRQLVTMLMDSDEEFKASVLFIPDFCIEGETTKKHDAAKRVLIDLVRDRLIKGLPMGIYAPSSGNVLSQAYGAEFVAELRATFIEGVVK